MPDEDKNFGGSLVLDFGKWWRHVKTIYMSYFCTSQSNATTAVIGQFPAISQPNQIWLWPRQMRESDRAFDSRKLSGHVRSRQTEYSPCQLSGFKGRRSMYLLQYILSCTRTD